MTDRFGRKIEYLRLSVTERCDLSCVYCRPEAAAHSCADPDKRSLVSICRAAAGLGIRLMRITGGEPLTRNDCPELVREIKAINGIERVYLTTNGTRLEQNAKALFDAGTDGINISLDTADREEYRSITRHDRLEAVNRGIDEAYRLGIELKLNCVVTGSTNEKTIDGLLSYPKYRNIDLRFIELMPIGGGRDGKTISNTELLEMIRDKVQLKKCSYKSSGPAVYYSSPELKGRIGFISAMSHSFCSECNRLRVTSDGILKPCLCYSSDISLKGITDSPDRLRNAFLLAAELKPLSHCFNSETDITERLTMDMIGG